MDGTGRRQGMPPVGAHVRALAEDRGRELVAAYYDPGGEFAGELFDSFGDNPPDRFTADDLVAASLLDVRYGPRAVRQLLLRGAANGLLAQVPFDQPIWADENVTSRGSTAWQLWDLLVSIPHVGATRASKLLARKRPHLFPILDSVVRPHLGVGEKDDSWKAVRQLLADNELRSVLDGLAPSGLSNTPSTLQLLDVLIWMRYSESDNARRVRARAGFRVDERPGRRSKGS